MDNASLLRVAFLAVGVLLGTVLIAIEVRQSTQQGRFGNVAHIALGGIVVANVLIVVSLWINHINFPLNLDVMEGTVIQHFQRAAAFEPIYPEPTPGYVPLAYNALFYVFAVPFSWVFGVNLFTLRLVAILGAVGSGLILYLVLKERTKSIWWGLLAVGLYAAAYMRMDAYLDTAHADSWLLFTALLGSYIIDRNRSRAWNLVGVLILIASFWFKQHGALFVIGGVLYLTWREGIKRSILYWLVAFILGPVLYLFGGPRLFGSDYIYFTWEVPRQWSELTFATIRRYIAFILKSYPILALSSGAYTLWIAIRERASLNIWHFQLVFALLSGFMGTLDAGSSDNVFIPMGAWFILVGTLGLHEFVSRVELVQRYRVHLFALFITFAILAYNPFRVTTSPKADQSYTDLVAFLNDLDGPVYAPSIGQLQRGYTFYPTAHWVALEDMIRGPGRDTSNHPNTRRLLQPAIEPNGPAYILANYPLEVYYWIEFLNDYYVLESDLGDRFEPLRVLPARWDHGWPRYLYRYSPEEVNQ